MRDAGVFEPHAVKALAEIFLVIGVQFAGEVIRLHAMLDATQEKLRLANTGSLPLLYDIRRELGWRPQVDFRQGIAGVVAWYRAHRAWWEAIVSGAYRDYYQAMYGARLRDAT